MSRSTVSVLLLLICGAVVVFGEPYPIDGVGNNVDNPNWGAYQAPLLRIAGYAYEDGSSLPRGDGGVLPSTREVSYEVNSLLKIGSPLSPRHLSDYVTYWGQFIDHDLDVTPTDCNDRYDIPIPQYDMVFNPTNRTDVTMKFCRSTFINGSDPRDQFNDITAYIDASHVYGSNQMWVDGVREYSEGRLGSQMLDGEEYPDYNDNGGMPILPMGNGAGRVPLTELFIAGDRRANENPMLLALHTIFLREHNRRAAEATGTDEERYQEARRWVIAHVQAITYYEYLPALFGRQIPYSGVYNSSINPGIDAFFSGSSFRYGHSEVKNTLLRRNRDFSEYAGGDLFLARSYFFPEATVDGGIEPILIGAAVSTQHEVDGFIVEALRDMLFGLSTNLAAPGHAMDLGAVNMQRGRDHGIPGYNDVRASLGLSRCGANDWACVTNDVDIQNVLSNLYSSTDDLDSFIAGLVEPHVDGNLGALFSASIEDQFVRVREGDRLYFEHNPDFTEAEVETIRNTKLSDIILRNTGITDLPNDLFAATELITEAQCNCGDSEECDSAGQRVTSTIFL